MDLVVDRSTPGTCATCPGARPTSATRSDRATGRAHAARTGRRKRDPDRLADLARRQLRRKIPQLKQALTGRFTDAHALALGEILAHVDYLEAAIGRLSTRIDEVISPFATEPDLLATIPGVDCPSSTWSINDEPDL